jgi:hypothetical protein
MKLLRVMITVLENDAEEEDEDGDEDGDEDVDMAEVRNNRCLKCKVTRYTQWMTFTHQAYILSWSYYIMA